MIASIIVAAGSPKIMFDNFMCCLSQYDTINDYEIILINDNDDYTFSKDEFEAYNLKNLKILNPDSKLGYGVANNIAVSHSSCDILIFMNDDIMLMPHCLEILVEDLKEGKASAVQPKLIYPQSGKIQSTGHIFTNYTNAHALENADRYNKFAIKSNKRQALTTALCATWKKLFEQMNFFDDIYYNAWEGMEFTLKLTNSGYKCLYEAEAEAYHFRGGARNNYALNEQAQSAVFWSRWQSKIKSDLPDIIKEQIDLPMDAEYLMLNFSELTTAIELISACGIKLWKTISYSYISGQQKVDLYKVVPSKITSIKQNIIYFTNNFTQVINNHLWFEARKNNHDIIIDLCGNVVYCE